MDRIRRARLDELFPILAHVHTAIVDLMDQEQEAHDAIPANLREARQSEVHHINEAERALVYAIDCMKYASGIEQVPELPAAPTVPFERRF
jgi:hypothetical protein